jgi:hypothetical protein
MALPSRPNSRIGGLPSNPSPRSRSLSTRAPAQGLPPRSNSTVGDRPYIHSRATSAPLPQNSQQQLRPQRSLPSLASSPPQQGRLPQRPRIGATPPVPPVPKLPPSIRQPSSRALYSSRNESSGSISSAYSSDTPSDLSNPWDSPATSATSVEDNVDKESLEPDPRPAPGFGYSLWSRVAAAAGTLTVNVSKAWEANVGSVAGEGTTYTASSRKCDIDLMSVSLVTPPGQESRLTRALKAYHIEQARQPSDLPEWLFDERERGVRRTAPSEEHTTAKEVVKEVPMEPRSTARPVDPPRETTPLGRARTMLKKAADDDATASMSRATQHLRALRDAKAKRTPTIRFVDTPHPRHAAASAQEKRPAELPVIDRRYAFPTSRDLEPPLPTNAVPISSLRSSGRRPTAVGLPTSVRPRR